MFTKVTKVLIEKKSSSITIFKLFRLNYLIKDVVPSNITVFSILHFFFKTHLKTLHTTNSSLLIISINTS